MSIRFASKEDCAAIAEIYNHAVLHTAAIWNDQTVDAENRISWYESRQLMGYPVLVSEENGVVTGYASFGDWRNFDGFRHTVEHSVYVHPEHQGKGLGKQLLEHAKNLRGELTLAVYKENAPSLAFYRSQGFTVLREQVDAQTGHAEYLMALSN